MIPGDVRSEDVQSPEDVRCPGDVQSGSVQVRAVGSVLWALCWGSEPGALCWGICAVGSVLCALSLGLCAGGSRG